MYNPINNLIYLPIILIVVIAVLLVYKIFNKRNKASPSLIIGCLLALIASGIQLVKKHTDAANHTVPVRYELNDFMHTASEPTTTTTRPLPGDR